MPGSGFHRAQAVLLASPVPSKEGLTGGAGESGSMQLRRKLLGQYFTPPTVVDFALQALRWLGGTACAPPCESLLDPSCGDGAFVRAAVEGGYVMPSRAWGLDRDPSLREQWVESGLYRSDGPNLHVADGLLEDPRQWGAPQGGFHWVVGNPPYAGEGLKSADAALLADVAARFALCARRCGRVPDPQQVRRFPVEVLFLERFWQLCRPGGLMAIVLPVGIFANDRWRFVREWLVDVTTIHAVVGLPRRAFGAHGITAKTCLAVLGKSAPPPGHQVALAEVERIGVAGEPNDLPGVLELWANGTSMAAELAPWRAAVRDL